MHRIALSRTAQLAGIGVLLAVLLFGGWVVRLRTADAGHTIPAPGPDGSLDVGDVPGEGDIPGDPDEVPGDPGNAPGDPGDPGVPNTNGDEPDGPDPDVPRPPEGSPA